MTLRRLTRIGAGLAAALALAACGNGRQDLGNVLRQVPARLFQRPPEPQPLTPQQIAVGLTQNTAPVVLFEIPDQKAQFLLSDIEQNGPYHTYGNVARRTIVLRQGMITATRGFGGDLMSSDEDQLLSYVSAGREGRVSYDQRFVTPEDVTIVRRYTCYVSSGARVPVSGVLAQATGRLVEADCTAADGVSPDFSNAYAVSPDGNILKSKHWVSPTLGYINTQVLRR